MFFHYLPFSLVLPYLFYKTSYLNEEVNCTQPPPVSIPWIIIRSFLNTTLDL